MGEFVTVGRADEIPDGEMRAFRVDGYGVTIANVGGVFRAFQDECTHQTCSLAEGDIEGDAVVCVCHNAEFDLKSGEPLSGPARDPIPVFDVRIEGEDLQVAL